MRYLFHFLTFFLTFGLNAQIEFSATSIDLGNIESAYEIKADLIIKNTGTKNLYLLKADCDRGVKVFTSKKTIPANDTALLVISFIPEGNGKFFKDKF